MLSSCGSCDPLFQQVAKTELKEAREREETQTQIREFQEGIEPISASEKTSSHQSVGNGHSDFSFASQKHEALGMWGRIGTRRPSALLQLH